MFFKPKIFEQQSDRKITFEVQDDNPIGEINDTIKEVIGILFSENPPCENSLLCTQLIVQRSITEEIKSRIEDSVGSYFLKNEEYAIVLGEKTVIYAHSDSALLFALMTLRQLSDFGELTEGFIYDYPESSFRAFRVYVPGRENIDKFKKMIDFLAYYKYNTIMIQVGGAMEYKLHPEINKKWEEYCNYLTEFPYRTQYHRNKWNFLTCGTHPDAGDGSYITQEEMKDIVNYCKKRNFSVIPEIPSYNHCDYLVMAHPEIRELSRAHDCADGYCPSNPASYELLFDVIDEIIDVFEPEYINIAHDELCQINVCEKCREKSPADLLVEDVTKIHDYLASKNVGTMMWADSMSEPTQYGRTVPGRGAGFNKKGDWDYIPPFNECRARFPKDIIMINWLFAGIYENSTSIICGENYPQIWGNFALRWTDKWKSFAGKYKLRGAMVSNWGTVDTYYMRKNLMFYDLICASYSFWSHDYDDTKRDEVFRMGYEESYRYYNKYYKEHSLDTIEIAHTTDLNLGYRRYYSAARVDEKDFKLGDYIVMYSDGTTAKLPVVFGDNISYCKPSVDLMAEVSCTVQIIEGGMVYYKHIYENPFPEKVVMGVQFLKKLPREFNLYVNNIKFN